MEAGRPVKKNIIVIKVRCSDGVDWGRSGGDRM